MKYLLVIAVLVSWPADAAGQSRGVYIETGVQAGGVIGVESVSHSSVRAVSEIGYMFAGGAEHGTAWGGGATVYAGLGREDMRLGIKPRVRYRFRPQWFVDVSAGFIFATLENDLGVSDTGFVGGVHLGYGKWWTLRADVNVKKVDEFRYVTYDPPVLRESGYETAVYAGLALRNKGGWVAAAVGTAALLGLMVLVVVSGGAS